MRTDSNGLDRTLLLYRGMRIQRTNYDNVETGCCAELNAADWDGKEFEWEDKVFLKDHVRAVFHMPLNFGSVMRRDLAVVQSAEAYPEQPLWLTDDVSAWRSNLYIALDREIAGVEIEKLSGKFLAKVFEGPFRHAGKWAQAMEAYVKAHGYRMQKLYFYYATCPKCAKHYGKNQVVLFAQVVPETVRGAERVHPQPSPWPGDSFPASDPPAWLAWKVQSRN